MKKFTIPSLWLCTHLKNSPWLVYSIRQYMEMFPNLNINFFGCYGYLCSIALGNKHIYISILTNIFTYHALFGLWPMDRFHMLVGVGVFPLLWLELESVWNQLWIEFNFTYIHCIMLLGVRGSCIYLNKFKRSEDNFFPTMS